MTQATKEVIDISLKRKVDLRTAAYISGINKLHEFYALSGIPGCEWWMLLDNDKSINKIGLMRLFLGDGGLGGHSESMFSVGLLVEIVDFEKIVD